MTNVRGTLFRIGGTLLAAGSLAFTAACGLNVVGTCAASGLSANGTATANTYSYHGDCTNLDGDVSASFGLNDRAAKEKITTPKGKVTVTWVNCSGDPWLDANATCTRDKVSATFEYAPALVDGYRRPYTSTILSPTQRQQLKGLLDQSRAPKPKPDGVLTPIPATGPSPFQQPKPDLVMVSVKGPAQPAFNTLSGYTFTVRNDGKDAPSQTAVELLFPVPLNPVVTPNAGGGFTCLSTQPRLVTCTGPALTKGQTASFTLQAIPSAAGAGTITATVNKGNAIDEATTANNTATLAITVK